MERRADPGGSLAQSKTETAKEVSKTWQAVRRALGRLVSHVDVRRVEDAERTIPAAVLRGELALPPPHLPLNAGWQPSVRVCLAPVPSAGTGLRESDLVPAVSLAQGNYALSPPETYVMPIAGLELRVDKPALEWPVEVVSLPDAFVRLPASPVRTQSVPLLPLPKTAPLRGWAVQTPPTGALRLPRFAEPRVRWGGDTILRRMPLTRRGKAFGEAAAERRRLAETVHLRPEEITLLGIYPDVPILAVERIVVEDEGRQLRLWLKPEVLRSRSASHRITLLVGRQISNGKMLQAAL
jgi:hypothetical protein